MKRFSEFLRNHDELLAVIVGLTTSITFIWKQAGGLPELEDRHFLATIDILNIAVLAIALLIIKSTPLTIDSKEFQKLIRLGSCHTKHIHNLNKYTII